jgi:hypothetical protein
MKYFLGEIVITHRKSLFGWHEYYHKFTIILITANNWE